MELTAALAPLLPRSKTPYHVLNVASCPKKSKRIFHDAASQTTVKTQHFITVYQGRTPVFGIELFVYVILLNESTQRILFVSKADTTGLFDKSLSEGQSIRVGPLTEAIVSYVLHIPISFYLKQVLVPNDSPGRTPTSAQNSTQLSTTQLGLRILADRWKTHGDLARPLANENVQYIRRDFTHNGPVVTKVCLFTRPEPQYLFPFSNKNAGKHVLSGDQLLKWWCRIVDSVVKSQFTGSAECKLLVPGAETRTVQRYFPGMQAQWAVGDIFSSGAGDLAVHRVPFFPDDPKSRFLEHIVVEGRAKKVKMAQFWVELSVRQEFRLGITVGVIGVSGPLVQASASGVEQIVTLKKKSLKKLKDFIVGEDYSVPNELESFDIVKNLHRGVLREIWGTGSPKAKRTIEAVSAQAPAQPMMVVRKKKKTAPQ